MPTVTTTSTSGLTTCSTRATSTRSTDSPAFQTTMVTRCCAVSTAHQLKTIPMHSNYYGMYVDNPFNLGVPRTIRLGEVDFN